MLEIEWKDLGDTRRLQDVVQQLQLEGAYDAISKDFVRYPAIDHRIGFCKDFVRYPAIDHRIRTRYAVIDHIIRSRL